jgi:hypothetical protein
MGRPVAVGPRGADPHARPLAAATGRGRAPTEPV